MMADVREPPPMFEDPNDNKDIDDEDIFHTEKKVQRVTLLLYFYAQKCITTRYINLLLRLDFCSASVLSEWYQKPEFIRQSLYWSLCYSGSHTGQTLLNHLKDFMHEFYSTV